MIIKVTLKPFKSHQHLLIFRNFASSLLNGRRGPDVVTQHEYHGNSSSSTHSIASLDSFLPIIFIRHGQSTWNKSNIFIGMTDTPLTDEGIEEAVRAGSLLKTFPDYTNIDMVHTSLLRRSTHTAWLVMKELEQEWVPVHKVFALNERSYGSLVGQNKKQLVDLHGKDQVKLWRRSWDTPPPPMSKESQYFPYQDVRYRKLGIREEEIPLSESLKDVTLRTSKYWDETIRPQLLAGKRLLIVGHENNLRSIIKRLDGISNEAILSIELPRAVPLVFHLDPVTLKPIKLRDHAEGLSGKYLMNADDLIEIAHRDHHIVYGANTDIPVPSFTHKERKVAEGVRRHSIHHNIRSARLPNTSSENKCLS